MSVRYIVFLFLFLLPAVGCMPRSTSSGGSGQVSLVKVYNKAEGGTLYFAGPMAYKSTNSKDEISVDFSLTKPIDASEGIVICNFTYITRSNPDFEPVQVELAAANAAGAVVANFEKFYSELRRKRYRYRYSFQVSESIWVRWMERDNHQIVLNGQPFIGGKKHKKHIEEVRAGVLFPLK